MWHFHLDVLRHLKLILLEDSLASAPPRTNNNNLVLQPSISQARIQKSLLLSHAFYPTSHYAPLLFPLKCLLNAVPLPPLMDYCNSLPTSLLACLLSFLHCSQSDIFKRQIWSHQFSTVTLHWLLIALKGKFNSSTRICLVAYVPSCLPGLLLSSCSPHNGLSWAPQMGYPALTTESLLLPVPFLLLTFANVT